jgi:UTP--glucose-1-phosphate uridylyltransferase
VLFVTGRRKRAIEDHFDADPELERALGSAADSLADTRAGLKVLYTRQPRPAGLGDALRYAEGFSAGGGAVAVALGDTIIEPPGILNRLMDAYEEHGAAAALAVEQVQPEAVSRYGIVIPSLDARQTAGPVIDVADVIEKPAPGDVDSRLAVAARYVLGPSVFAVLRETPPDAAGEVQLADALRRIIQAGGRVVAVPLSGGEQRHDIGTVESYCAAFLELALNDPRVGPALRDRAAALLNDAR